MKTTNIPQKSLKDIPQYLSTKLIDTLLNKYLFVTLILTLFFTVKDMWLSGEIGQLVFLTIDSNIIGNRPSRLFGLLSLVEMSNFQARIAIFLICLITTVLIAYLMVLFIREITDGRIKIIVITGVLMAITVIFNYYKYMMWDFANIALYVALMLGAYSFWFLLKTNKKFLAILIAAVSVIVDCRAFIFMAPVMIIIMLGKPENDEQKRIRFYNLIVLGVSAASLMFLFMTADFKNDVDTVLIDEIFKERFVENGTAVENISKTMYAFKFEIYLRITPQELFVNTLTDIFYIKDIIYEDQFQLIILLFLCIIILYDRKSNYKVDDVNNLSEVKVRPSE